MHAMIHRSLNKPSAFGGERDDFGAFFGTHQPVQAVPLARAMSHEGADCLAERDRALRWSRGNGHDCAF